jgi:hypothetical protein
MSRECCLAVDSDKENRFIQCLLSFNRQITNHYNINMNFQFDAEESRYTTFPNHVKSRTEYLKSIIMSTHPVIVDGFSCVGGDTIVFMADFPSADVFAVQRVATEKEKERFNRLTYNVSEFNTKFRQDKCLAITIPTTIQHFLPHIQTDVDLLYLDPPWEITEGHEYDEQDVLDYISSIIACASSSFIRYVMIKIRYDISKGHIIPGYALKKTFRVMNSERLLYCFHVFENTKEKSTPSIPITYLDPWGNPES